MSFSIQYHRKVVTDDIPDLGGSWQAKIKDAIERKLTVEPATYGKPLRRSLKGYRRLRVGDYRVVFRVYNRTVMIGAIIHRRNVYNQATKRL